MADISGKEDKGGKKLSTTELNPTKPDPELVKVILEKADRKKPEEKT